MKITEKCKVIVAGSLVAALMAGTALPALAASPPGTFLLRCLRSRIVL